MKKERLIYREKGRIRVLENNKELDEENYARRLKLTRQR